MADKPSEAKPAPQPQAAAQPAQQPDSTQGQGMLEEPGRSFFGRLLWATPSWMVSMVVHAVLLLVLAVIQLSVGGDNAAGELVVNPGEEDALEELPEEFEDDYEDIDFNADDLVSFESDTPSEEFEISEFDDLTTAEIAVDIDPLSLDTAMDNDFLADIGSVTGDALQGRGSGKGQLVAKNGGSEGSEKAVALALEWLVKHQMPDGGWSFNHSQCPTCRGQCRHPGEGLDNARNGATALALLPFLGAGQTHTEGKYKDEVKAGLYYLVSHMILDPTKGGSMHEPGGTMYSHGLASIVLCEAYAMTHDKELFEPAQLAVNFICTAQDPIGGGWRYNPGQRGDTSVVGWQVMALKSGHMAYLRIPPMVVKKAYRYLDTVQSKSGAAYGYNDPGAGDATTAIGLLCRMYLGWTRDEPALQRGVASLSAKGPSGDAYYNYYATQVMRHWEGEEWEKWNNVMRDKLVDSQATKGHETGSWAPGAGHGKKGGRLYETSMSTMILEVYYRHLPIYRKQSTEEDFPLD